MTITITITLTLTDHDSDLDWPWPYPWPKPWLTMFWAWTQPRTWLITTVTMSQMRCSWTGVTANSSEIYFLHLLATQSFWFFTPYSTHVGHAARKGCGSVALMTSGQASGLASTWSFTSSGLFHHSMLRWEIIWVVSRGGWRSDVGPWVFFSCLVRLSF